MQRFTRYRQGAVWHGKQAALRREFAYRTYLRSLPMKTLTVLALMALVAAPLAAQDSTRVPTANVAGNWDFSFTSPQGAATWRVKFDQAGDTLRGSAATDFGQLDVVDGWISGNDLSFTLNLNFNGQAIQVNFAGTVKGDTAQGNVDVPGVGIQPFPFTAVKATGVGVGAAIALAMFPAERPRLVPFQVVSPVAPVHALARLRLDDILGTALVRRALR
jgi:hypothetical protein